MRRGPLGNWPSGTRGEARISALWREQGTAATARHVAVARAGYDETGCRCESGKVAVLLGGAFPAPEPLLAHYGYLLRRLSLKTNVPPMLDPATWAGLAAALSNLVQALPESWRPLVAKLYEVLHGAYLRAGARYGDTPDGMLRWYREVLAAWAEQQRLQASSSAAPDMRRQAAPAATGQTQAPGTERKGASLGG